jgi:hypothetical protein
MESHEIEQVLAACEHRLDQPGPVDVGSLGLWKAVAAVKRDGALTEKYADRIARIDDEAFRRWAVWSIPIGVGEALLWAGTLIALGVVAAGYYVDSPLNGVLLIVGTGGLLVTTHGLGHLVVGRRFGIRFTWLFIGRIQQPQPGVKTDYASYLRTPAARRAWMHASGALVTKAIPFIMLGAAFAMDAPAWSWMLLIVIGLVAIITDVAWSTSKSDWKKFRREMALTRVSTLPPG